MFNKFLQFPITVQGIGFCRKDVTPLREYGLPAKLMKASREVEESCEARGLRLLFYYAYPPFWNGMDFGAAFWTTDRRTASFLHYCKDRWPPTYFYCISRLPEERFLITSDMHALTNYPPEFEPDCMPYHRFYPEDVFELHTKRLLGKDVLPLEEFEVGPLIAEVQNRYARYHAGLEPAPSSDND